MSGRQHSSCRGQAVQQQLAGRPAELAGDIVTIGGQAAKAIILYGIAGRQRSSKWQAGQKILTSPTVLLNEYLDYCI